MKAKIKRVYHHYLDWEEIDHNMWGSVTNRKAFLLKAIKFTGDHKLYGRFMMRVALEWPISCENALTDQNINQKAWIGHAACALALGCPEDITRQAWKELSYEQQFLANKEAERAIQTWKYNYFKDKGIRENVGEALL
jgi:hypothetical protein